MTIKFSQDEPTAVFPVLAHPAPPRSSGTPEARKHGFLRPLVSLANQHLVNLALQWPENAENLSTQLFAEALKCSKAVVVLQDPESTRSGAPDRAIRPHGTGNQHGLSHFDLRMETLSKLARKEGFVAFDRIKGCLSGKGFLKQEDSPASSCFTDQRSMQVMWTQKPNKVGPLEESISKVSQILLGFTPWALG